MGDSILFILLLAMTVAIVAALGVQVVFSMMEKKRRALQERLGGDQVKTGTVYGPILLESTELTGLASKSQLFADFSRNLKRAYPNVLLGRYLVLVGSVAAFAFVIGAVAMGSVLIGAFAALVAIVVPYWRVSARCGRRLRAIDEQLPDALDFLSRILRAGHSLTTGFQMASDELPEPLASELRTCYDQNSLGTPMENAMRDMAERVGTSDFAFFVTAVLIQRQTGGDLAEVLHNIAGMVRARLRLQQHVKAITAQGRLVGSILLVMPIVFFLVVYTLNREYASVLLREREGIMALAVAGSLQVLGVVTIKRITAVKM